MIEIVLSVISALLLFNMAEWFVHKNILHKIGANKKSMWSFHWHEHHQNSRKNNMVDKDYLRSLFGWHAQSKELLGLILPGLLFSLLLPFCPYFVLTIWYCMIEYYYKHKKCHRDMEWGFKNLRWHYDHHMGKNQNANWGVVRPWADMLFGTRIKYEYDKETMECLHRKV